VATKRSPIQFILSIIDKVSSPLDKIEGKAEATRAAVDRLSGAFESVSAAGRRVAAVGVVMTLLAASTVKAYADVQSASLPLQTVVASTMGGVEQSMAAATAAARDWSARHKQSAAEFLTASYRMASAGLNDIQAIEGTRTAMAVATATMGDGVQTAQALATTYNVLGDKTADVAAEMGRLGDLLTITQQRFQFADLNQLTEGLKYATPTAKQFGVSLEQTLAVLGELNSAGITGGQAGTAYSAALRTMNKAAGELGFTVQRTADGQLDLIATIGEIAAKYGNLAAATPEVQDAFQKAFGDEGVRMIALLMEKAELLKVDLDAVTNSAGATAKSLAIMESGLGAQWQIFKNLVGNAAAAMGKELAPAARVVIGLLSSMAEWFGEMAEAHPTLMKIVAWGLLLGGVVMTVVGVLLMMVGALGHLVTFALGGFGGLAQLPLLLRVMRNWAQAAGFVIRGTLVTALRTAATSAWGFAAALAANPLTWIVVGVALAAAQIYLLVKHFDQVKAWLSGVPQWAIFAFQAFMGPIAAVYGAAATLIKQWDKVKAFFTGLGEWWRGAGAGFVNAFIEGIKGAWSGGIAAIRELFMKLRAYLPFSDAKTGPLSDLTASGKAFAVTFATGVQSGDDDVEGAVGRAMGKARPRRSVNVRGGNKIGAVNITVNGGGRSSDRDMEAALGRVLRRYSWEMA
jgi:TP901 family phage tail tape measure protein